MGLTATNFAPFLKSLWPQKRVENLVYQNQPFLAMVPKATNFVGENAVIPVQYGDTQGRSATFATAQAMKGNLNSKKFTITRVKDYALASVDGELMDATQNDMGALAKAWDRETTSAMHALKRSLGQSLYRSGTGAVGQRGSVSSAVLTLTDIRDVVNFEVGDQITASATDGGALLDSGDYVSLIAIDRDAGTLTADANWSAIATMADTNYLFKRGDGADTGANKKISGLAAWLPSTAPSSTAFFGVDRTADVVRLGGKRIDISAMSPSEGLVKAANSLGLEGGSPNVMFCHFDQFTNIQHDLGSKVQYEELRVGEIAFEAIRINGPTGPIKIVPDLNCPSTKAYMLQLDTWKLFTLGECPKFLDLDGLKMLREATSDGYEVRIGYYGQLYCTAPGWNACITMPTLS
jgi:hypothetical protein